MVILLHDSQAYCVGIYRKFDFDSIEIIEAMEFEDKKEVEEAWAFYLGKIIFKVTIMTAFKVVAEDKDKKINKYFSASYDHLVSEFLKINEYCNTFGISILRTAKRTIFWAMQFIEEAKDAEIRYDFEEKIPSQLILLRAQTLSRFSKKAYEKDLTDFFARAGLKL